MVFIGKVAPILKRESEHLVVGLLPATILWRRFVAAVCNRRVSVYEEPGAPEGPRNHHCEFASGIVTTKRRGTLSLEGSYEAGKLLPTCALFQTKLQPER